VIDEASPSEDEAMAQAALLGPQGSNFVHQQYKCLISIVDTIFDDDVSFFSSSFISY
jgi:hypothetical protein